MTMQEILAKVPDYKAFLTVDEMDARVRALAAAHPEAQLRTIGYSRAGHPILCLVLGGGAKNALCFACPHPNEPIGAMTVLTLADLFLNDPALLAETGFTWHLIHCIDPDGTRLNEGWFKGPFNLSTYAEHYYRPPGTQQVEWTFPVDYKNLQFDKPIPETKALMDLIDEIKPAFTFSLHNASFGGAYWYSTESDAAFCAALEGAAKRQGVPLALGEPESPYIEKYSPGVHSMMSMKKHVDYMEEFSGGFDAGGIACGTCSADYIDTVCKCLTLMAELPYFYDKRIDDTSPTNRTRREVMLENIRLSEETAAFMRKWYDTGAALFGDDNPFPGLVEEHITACEANGAARRKWAMKPEFDVPATVSEELDNIWLQRYYECLFIGLLRRAALFELAKQPADPASVQTLEALRDAAAAELKRQTDALEGAVEYSVIPIQTLVRVQVESAFCAVRFLNGEPLTEAL